MYIDLPSTQKLPRDPYHPNPGTMERAFVSHLVLIIIIVFIVAILVVVVIIVLHEVNNTPLIVNFLFVEVFVASVLLSFVVNVVHLLMNWRF